MPGVAGTGHDEELFDKLPEDMLHHPKLVFDVPGIATKQLIDPHLTCECRVVIWQLENLTFCIKPSCSCCNHVTDSSPVPQISLPGSLSLGQSLRMGHGAGHDAGHGAYGRRFKLCSGK